MTAGEYKKAIKDYLTYKINKHEIPLQISVEERVKILNEALAELGLN